MMGEEGDMDGLMSGIGVALASAALLLIVLSMYRSAGQADSAIALQSAATDVCRDVGTVAASTLPYSCSVTYATEGVSLNVTSEYVIARDSGGREHARPLATRVYPGRCEGEDGIAWNGTDELRELLNTSFGGHGTPVSPLSSDRWSDVSGLLDRAGRYMASCPLEVEPRRPLTIEKLFFFAYNNTTGVWGSEPYVFVYQR